MIVAILDSKESNLKKIDLINNIVSNCLNDEVRSSKNVEYDDGLFSDIEAFSVKTLQLFKPYFTSFLIILVSLTMISLYLGATSSVSALTRPAGLFFLFFGVVSILDLLIKKAASRVKIGELLLGIVLSMLLIVTNGYFLWFTLVFFLFYCLYVTNKYKNGIKD